MSSPLRSQTRPPAILATSDASPSKHSPSTAPSPIHGGGSRVFDLDAEPATSVESAVEPRPKSLKRSSLPRVARIYVCLVAKELEREAPEAAEGDAAPDTQARGACEPQHGQALDAAPAAGGCADTDAPLVTSARIERGLAILRAKRASHKGLFVDSFTPDQRARRPLYPFLPRDLPADTLEDLIPYDSTDLNGGVVSTNIELPVPVDLSGARADLLHHVVKWLYSHMFPSFIVQRQPRYEEDEQIWFPDPDRPIDMDKRYDDAWLSATIRDEVLASVKSIRDGAARGSTYKSSISWAHDREALAPILAEMNTKRQVYTFDEGRAAVEDSS